MITSLKGLNFYLQKVPHTESKQQHQESIKALLNDPKFWAFHKHSHTPIRSAWYELASTILSTNHSLLHEEQIVRVTFKCMDEDDPLIAPFVWACVVLIQTNIPAWQTYVNVEKQLLPKLWKVLRSATNAPSVFPYLLPFISKIGKAHLGEEHFDTFHDKFFANLIEALKTRRSSKTETNAIVSAYYEALKYIILQMSESPLNKGKCIKFVDDHLIAIIYWSLNNKDASNGIIYNHIGSLLNFWESRKTNVVNAAMLSHFWHELYLTFESTLQSKADIETFGSLQTELVKHLKGSTKVKGTVRYADADSAAAQPMAPKTLNEGLSHLVFKLCILYIERIEEYKSANLIRNLEILLKDFRTKGMLEELAVGNGIFEMYQKIYKWLLASPEMYCESTVEIILIFYNYLADEERHKVLEDLAKIPTSSTQDWILQRLVSHPICLSEWIPAILCGEQIRGRLIECAQAVVSGEFP